MRARAIIIIRIIIIGISCIILIIAIIRRIIIIGISCTILIIATIRRIVINGITQDPTVLKKNQGYNGSRLSWTY